MREEKAYCDLCGNEVKGLKENLTLAYSNSAIAREEETRVFHVCIEEFDRKTIRQILQELQDKGKLKAPPGITLREIRIDPSALELKKEG